MKMFRSSVLGVALAALLVGGMAGRASAQAGNNPLITVDENGHGSILFPGSPAVSMPGVLAPDPGPGGANSALSYNLLGPPFLTPGDLILREPGSDGASDVIRFNSAGSGDNPAYPASLVFYSDLADGADSLADIGSPGALYTNVLLRDEVGSEGDNGYVYTPTDGQPGWVPGFAVTYNIISDSPSATPEPASLALLATGGLPLLGILRRRRTA
jgi:hypothetical protein